MLCSFSVHVGCSWFAERGIPPPTIKYKFLSFFLPVLRTTGLNERRISMKSLPKKPNLEFLKKQAKELRTLHRQRDPSCCSLIRQLDTSLSKKSDSEIMDQYFSINDAQRIIAREYGYSSWATLKQFIQSLGSKLYNSVNDKKSYHKVITDSYDERSKDYDNSEWHRGLALQTVDYVPPKVGHEVLDIATGTGTIAFHTADIVGPGGSVTGIDISRGMLAKCNEKLSNTNVHNLKFKYADAENLKYKPDTFDRIYCSSAFFWMSNPQATLRHWIELLKPDGILGLNAFTEDSFIWGGGARKALGNYGIDFNCNVASGSVEKCRQLLFLAGYENIQIHEEKYGRYIKLENERPTLLTEEDYSPGQYPHPLTGVSKEILQKAQLDFEADVKKHMTDEGVWHDMTMYYVYGKKES